MLSVSNHADEFVEAKTLMTPQAMIQSLKEDSARWYTERRSRTEGTKHYARTAPRLPKPAKSNCSAGSSSNRFSGASGAAYDISEPSFPKGSSRDSYETVLPRYPGSDAPGYSGGGSSQQAYQQQYDNRQQQGYSSGQYTQGQQAFASQNQGGDRYAQSQAQGGAYSSQAYGYGHPQPETGAPYVNVGAHRTTDAAASDRSGGYASSTTYPAGTYPPQGQDPRYYQGQPQAYAQPTDPVYGRGNYPPATTQADYGSSAQPVYQYDSQYQTANPAQVPATQDPRAATSSPVSTQAQTGHSASQSRHHRDREHRENSSRHSRRPN